jgi:hypothetical protein
MFRCFFCNNRIEYDGTFEKAEAEARAGLLKFDTVLFANLLLRPVDISPTVGEPTITVV